MLFFSSYCIPYGIQWVKIRRNREIFDRLLQKEDEIHSIEKEIIRNRKNFFQIKFFINPLFQNSLENPISFFNGVR